MTYISMTTAIYACTGGGIEIDRIITFIPSISLLNYKFIRCNLSNLPYTLYIVDIKKESFMYYDIIFDPKSGHSNIAQILTTLSPV